MYSIQDVKGNPGEPIARLNPLGWTCIGNLGSTPTEIQTNFTFVSKPSDEITKLIHQYWDIPNIPENSHTINQDEKTTMERTEKSLSYQDGRYSIVIPWKSEIKTQQIPDTYPVAEQRLRNTEKRLLRSPLLAKSYDEIIQKHQEKGYIRKVPPEEEKKPNNVWYLPHFPIIRSEKQTTKIRIVFDAAAQTPGFTEGNDGEGMYE
ncbi:uncharacterized protein [Antedon mediterranea]|uniref:uncharacterized protein n=1 Tax=Antedon mediterranea TaxID=105859 RepID=UPI003AF9F792